MNLRGRGFTRRMMMRNCLQISVQGRCPLQPLFRRWGVVAGGEGVGLFERRAPFSLPLNGSLSAHSEGGQGITGNRHFQPRLTEISIS